MKFRILYLLSFCLAFVSYSPAQHKASKKKSTTYTLNGKVTITHSHCGGAMPTEEMMRELQKPKPYSGKVFYVRKGNVNDLKNEIVLSFTVNANGEFSFELPQGTYSIIQKEQVNAFKLSDYNLDEHHVADEKCLKEWWAKPYHILEIKNKSVAGLEFKYHRQCFIDLDVPCIQYTGPWPP